MSRLDLAIRGHCFWPIYLDVRLCSFLSFISSLPVSARWPLNVLPANDIASAMPTLKMRIFYPLLLVNPADPLQPSLALARRPVYCPILLWDSSFLPCVEIVKIGSTGFSSAAAVICPTLTLRILDVIVEDFDVVQVLTLSMLGGSWTRSPSAN